MPKLTDNSLPQAINLSESPAVVILLKDEYDDITARLQTLENNQEILFRIINKLRQTATTGKKSDLRKRALANALVSRKNAGMTYAEIGKFLELGSRRDGKNTREQNMTHFGKILEASPNEFAVTSSRTRGGKLVKLTKTYYDHLLMGGQS